MLGISSTQVPPLHYSSVHSLTGNMISAIHFDTQVLPPAPQAIPAGSKVAVIGDGKLGLLVAQVLALQGSLKDSTPSIRHFGRHAEKLQLVKGTDTEVVQDNATIMEKHGQVNSSGTSRNKRKYLKGCDACHSQHAAWHLCTFLRECTKQGHEASWRVLLRAVPVKCCAGLHGTKH